MVNRRKNLISKLLCLTIFMSLVQTTVVFAEGTENSELTTSGIQSSDVVKVVDSVVAPKTTGAAVDLNVSDFAFDSESGTITKYRGTDTTVVIPSTINGVSVKKIGIEAFRERKDITNITIQNGIESMEYYAFYGCSSLTSMSIPDSMKSIGDGAFGFCDSLTNVIIPNSVTSIGNHAFLGCRKLTNINIPNSVKNIGNYAFEECDNIISMSIPEGVKSIGSGTFRSCNKLISVTLPNSITSIGYDAFYGCSNLIKMTIPNSVTNIEDEAFYGCSKLPSVIIPNGVTSIGSKVFYGCSSLPSMNIPSSVQSIGYDAFYACSGLKTMNIPNSVKSIGEGAFSFCDGLTSISIPNTITRIEAHTFLNCSKLTKIDIPINTTSIGNYAFEGCSGITTMNIPPTVKSLGDGIFRGCNKLTNIVLPKGVTSIGYDSFYGCSNLASVVIPSSVTSISKSAFSSKNTLFYVDSKGVSQLLLNNGIDPSKIILNNIPMAVKVASVGLNVTSLNWTVGKTGNFIATVLPINATNKAVTWKSSNPLVATVDANGKLIGISAGTTTITCTAADGSGKYATCAVTVARVATVKATSVGLNTNKLNWTVGQAGRFTATVLPANTTNKGLTWTTSNSKVATIDQNGNIKAVGVGTAVITCKANDGSNKSAICNVTVAAESKYLNVVSPLKDGFTYTFKGINVNFDNDVKVPLDWSKIKITDAKGVIVPIARVNTTISKKEFQMYCPSMVNGQYKLYIPANTITDISGKKYNKEIRIAFNVKLDTVVIDSKNLNVVSPLKDGFTYTFKGINVNFDNDVKVPLDWSKIKITDAKGAIVPIARVNTTISKKEFQMYCPSMVNGQYKLYIPANTITDVSGKKYNKEIRIAFNVNVSKDTVAPQLGPVKYLTQMNNGKDLTSFTMKWTKATDNISLQNKLRYYLYQSEGKDYGNNISQWETNSKLLNKGGSLDIGLLQITGISNEKTYYFKLVVEDEAHNKAAYTTEYREASITKGVNKKTLSDELYHAQEIAKFQVGNSLGQCSQSAMNELKKAISISQNVLNNNKATQAEVNNTVITLQQARYALSKTLITGLTSNTSSVLAKNNLDQTIQVQIVGCGDFINNFNKNNIILGGDFKGLTIKSASIVDSSHTYKANISLSGNLKKYTGSGTITVNGDGWIGLNGKKNITCSINVIN